MCATRVPGLHQVLGDDSGLSSLEGARASLLRRSHGQDPVKVLSEAPPPPPRGIQLRLSTEECGQNALDPGLGSHACVCAKPAFPLDFTFNYKTLAPHSCTKHPTFLELNAESHAKSQGAQGQTAAHCQGAVWDVRSHCRPEPQAGPPVAGICALAPCRL